MEFAEAGSPWHDGFWVRRSESVGDEVLAIDPQLCSRDDQER